MSEGTTDADADRHDMMQVLGQLGAPAYARRARAVEEALRSLLGQARARREEWLPMVRLHLARLRALAGGWDALAPWLEEPALGRLAALHAELSPRLRAPVAPTSSRRALRHALDELAVSLSRFNRRWADYLAELDLAPINALREGYNRYYVMEKECAVGSPAVARAGFRPLPPLDLAELREYLPLLPEVEWRSGVTR